MRGAHIASDDRNSLSAFFDGMVIPRPPRLAGSACRVVSRLFGGGLPVRAGIRFVCHQVVVTADQWYGRHYSAQIGPFAH